MKINHLKKTFRKGELSKPQFIQRMYLAHKRLFDHADLVAGSDLARLEITGHGIVATLKNSGIQILCDKNDRRSIPFEILNFGSFEARELEMLAGFCQGRKTFFDIGANVGWYSLNLAKRFPSLRVLAFEPIPRTYCFLRANIKLNKVSNIRNYNHGFSDHNGKLTFFLDSAYPGNASTARLNRSQKTQKVVCRVRTLDSFTKRTGAKVDVIKCDVEGAELLVLRGGLETLQRDRPVIFLEMLRKWAAAFDYHPNDIINLLAGLGYQCFVCGSSGLKPFTKVRENTKETNYFFLPKK